MLRGAKPVWAFSGVVPPPHAKARDDKTERRFSGLLSAMTGASGYRTQPTGVAARAVGLMPSRNFSRCSPGVRQGLLGEHPPFKLTHCRLLPLFDGSRGHRLGFLVCDPIDQPRQHS
jgi:hypothetical protein